jgi:hypothetical protein
VQRMGRTRRSAKGAGALFGFGVLATALSFRRTAIIGLLAGLAFLALRRRNASVLVSAALMTPIVGIVLYPLLYEVATATYHSFVVQGAVNARTRMTVDGFRLALQHFPFGVGLGRFGSATAREHYSPEYVNLGYNSIRGLGGPTNPNNHGRFLTDTQWPSIVGEAGLVGGLLWAAGLWRIYALFSKAHRSGDLPLLLLGFTGMGWMVHVLLMSVAYPVFVTTPTSPMLFGLAGIAAAILAARSEPTDPEQVDQPESGRKVSGPRVRPVAPPAVDTPGRRSAAAGRGRPRGEPV